MMTVGWSAGAVVGNVLIAMNSAKSGCSASISSRSPKDSPRRFDSRAASARRGRSSIKVLSLPATGSRFLRLRISATARSAYNGGRSEIRSGGSAAMEEFAGGGVRQIPVTLTCEPPRGVLALPTDRTVRPEIKTGSRCSATAICDALKLFGKPGFFGTFTSSSRARYLSALTIR